MNKDEWQRTEPTEIINVGWRTIVTKTFVLPDGETHDFQLLNHEDSHCAGVIALTKDNEVIVARQFRPGPEKIMDEIPGGGVDEHDGTDYMAAALRELSEETGYIPGKVTHLGDVYKDAYNNSTWHYYLAEDCELGPEGQHLDDHEYVQTCLISIAQFLDNANHGNMTDIGAVLFAYDILRGKQKEQNA